MKTVEELLIHLNSLNVRLWEEDGSLRYKAPKGTFTPALRVELIERKTEILARNPRGARTRGRERARARYLYFRLLYF